MDSLKRAPLASAARLRPLQSQAAHAMQDALLDQTTVLVALHRQSSFGIHPTFQEIVALAVQTGVWRRPGIKKPSRPLLIGLQCRKDLWPRRRRPLGSLKAPLAPMPYANNDQLAEDLQRLLPEHPQEISREAFHHVFAAHADDPRREEAAHRIAWAAVKRSYVKAQARWQKRYGKTS